MEEGKLIYAIIDLQCGECFPVPTPPCSRVTGIDNAPLEIVPYRDLAAVVSSIDLERFGQACPEPCRREGEECLRADMVRYQQVNLSLLEHCAVVPMRFGFTARDREHVEEVLEKAYLQLRTFLNRLKGKVELVVQAFWDLPKVLQEIATQEEEEKAKGKRQKAKGERDAADVIVEGRTIGERRSVEVGRRLFEAAEARKKELAAVIHAHLSPWAIDSSEGPLKISTSLPLEGGGRGRGCVEHIFNRSYLVEREKEPLFDAAVDRLGAGYDGDLTFRYIGPLPAYSFVKVELSQGNFEVIDQARKTLTLSEKASLEEIKATYRRLALTSHPDRHPQDARAEERFKAVTHAYEVLEAYCHSLQDFWMGADTEKGDRDRISSSLSLSLSSFQYSFAREDVERTFIVRER